MSARLGSKPKCCLLGWLVITRSAVSARLGIEPKLLTKIINMSSGRCWSSEVYNPCPGVIMGIPSSNNYQGGFGAELMAKVLQHFVTSLLSFAAEMG